MRDPKERGHASATVAETWCQMRKIACKSRTCTHNARTKSSKKWSRRNWYNVLCADESEYEQSGNGLSTVAMQGGGDSCQQLNTEGAVWWCGRPFQPSGTGELVKIDGIMKEKAYNKALVGHGWPSGGLGVGQRFILQQYVHKHFSNWSLNHVWQMKFTGT